MKDLSEIFWNASVDEIKRGYVYKAESGEFICLVCGSSFMKGVVYSDAGVFYEAEKFCEIHIRKEHSSMFEYLLNLDKKFTGLTDHQKNLLNFFYKGMSDSEIVKELDGGSTSTIRNHRFTLREKEKQAKVFLSIMELLNEKSSKKQGFISVHRTATMVDERYAITEDENDKILNKYFNEGLDGPLSTFPIKEKRKIAILKHIIERFELNRNYTEKEVNEILKTIYPDYVTIRRYLIEYGFMDRHNDGSLYWVKR